MTDCDNTAQMHTYSDNEATAIDDESTTVRTLNASDSGEITAMSVTVDIEHTWRGAAEETLDVHMVVERIGSKSVTYGFQFQRGDQKIAQGWITVVCCLVRHGQPPESCPIPNELVEKFSAYLQKVPARVQCNYLLWRVTAASMKYLNEEARKISLKS